jgi:hypothetical protein
MTEAYIISARTSPVDLAALEDDPAQLLTRNLLDSVGIPARRVQEIYWVGLEEVLKQDGQKIASAQQESGSGTAVFLWPQSPLLAHHTLHALARTIEAGERDMIILGQLGNNLEGAVLLLASPVVVGRYNLLPRARIGKRIVHPSAGFLGAAHSALETRAEESEDEETAVSPGAADVSWLAAAAPIGSEPLEKVFPAADWLLPASTEAPAFDLFLLVCLLKRLEEMRQPCGMLVSASSWGTTMGTLIERI